MATGIPNTETAQFVPLVWYRRDSGNKPSTPGRILVFSPSYKVGDPMRIRLIDVQFWDIMVDAEWYCYISEPEIVF